MKISKDARILYELKIQLKLLPIVEEVLQPRYFLLQNVLQKTIAVTIIAAIKLVIIRFKIQANLIIRIMTS